MTEPETRELLLEQAQRERAERRQAEDAPTEDGERQHVRRADKAAYLRERLAERARSEEEV
jgi:hypothetical protein